MKNLLSLSAALFALTSVSAEAAQVKDISFEHAGQTLRGHLYLPDNYTDGDKLPGVIVSGSWTSVKEQMAGGYAEKLADQGYAALAFDFRGWGESNINTPINLQYSENPSAKTQDIIAAASFLANRGEVDPAQISTLGICASAGYAIDAAHQSEQIISAAVVAPWLHDAEIVNTVYGENVAPLIAATEAAEASGEPFILAAAGSEDSDAVMKGPGYYTDPARGAIAAYDNKFSTMTWKPWLTYDAIQTASQINNPVLLVHSEAAAIPQGAKKFKAEGGDNVQLIMLDDITQFDFYDNEDAMNAAIKQLDKHFKAAAK